jgi:hypothetical protein
LVAAGLALASPVGASLVGSTVRISGITTNDTGPDTVFLDPADYLVNGSSPEVNYSGVTLDVRESAIVVSAPGDTLIAWEPAGGAAPFNGFVIADALGVLPAFTSFTLSSTAGLGLLEREPVATFDADTLWINFAPGGAGNPVRDDVRDKPWEYTFALTTATVPEPPVWLLFCVALLSALATPGRDRRLERTVSRTV